MPCTAAMKRRAAALSLTSSAGVISTSSRPSLASQRAASAAGRASRSNGCGAQRPREPRELARAGRPSAPRRGGATPRRARRRLPPRACLRRPTTASCNARARPARPRSRLRAPRARPRRRRGSGGARSSSAKSVPMSSVEILEQHELLVLLGWDERVRRRDAAHLRQLRAAVGPAERRRTIGRDGHEIQQRRLAGRGELEQRRDGLAVADRASESDCCRT